MSHDEAAVEAIDVDALVDELQNAENGDVLESLPQRPLRLDELRGTLRD